MLTVDVLYHLDERGRPVVKQVQGQYLLHVYCEFVQTLCRCKVKKSGNTSIWFVSITVLDPKYNKEAIGLKHNVRVFVPPVYIVHTLYLLDKLTIFTGFGQNIEL